MTVFGDTYSKYYNLLYKDKNYGGEYEYIHKIISMYKDVNSIKNVLDIGCGTGKHLYYFKRDGLNVAGVDMSEGMIQEARKNLSQEANLLCTKASEFRFEIKFDVILSLFHVMNYQTETGELEKVFANVSNHLSDNGLFIFDFWYGPAVLTDPPSVRIKRMGDDCIDITRIAEPKMNYNANIADINFEVLIENKKTHMVEKINETHRLRYLFLPEIHYFAKISGLYALDSFTWMTFNELSASEWYGLAILKKQIET